MAENISDWTAVDLTQTPVMSNPPRPPPPPLSLAQQRSRFEISVSNGMITIRDTASPEQNGTSSFHELFPRFTKSIKDYYSQIFTTTIIQSFNVGCLHTSWSFFLAYVTIMVSWNGHSFKLDGIQVKSKDEITIQMSYGTWADSTIVRYENLSIILLNNNKWIDKKDHKVMRFVPATGDVEFLRELNKAKGDLKVIFDGEVGVVMKSSLRHLIFSSEERHSIQRANVFFGSKFYSS
jgi:hypothetical protein